jgi:hypothetical protein
LLTACGSIDREWLFTGVRSEQLAEIKVAIRSVTSSPLTSWGRGDNDPPNEVILATADHKTYRARKVRGKWYIVEVVIVT